jgi:hypothetical protein
VAGLGVAVLCDLGVVRGGRGDVQAATPVPTAPTLLMTAVTLPAGWNIVAENLAYQLAVARAIGPA